jgi:1-acyl-sn-glycerol-3-phosphate acyltransferase
VPIVPLGVGGSERVMPKGSKFIYPRKLHVIVGKPIYPDLDITNPKAQRDAARKITADLHAELQRLFEAAQARVG